MKSPRDKFNGGITECSVRRLGYMLNAPPQTKHVASL